MAWSPSASLRASRLLSHHRRTGTFSLYVIRLHQCRQILAQEAAQHLRRGDEVEAYVLQHQFLKLAGSSQDQDPILLESAVARRRNEPLGFVAGSLTPSAVM